MHPFAGHRLPDHLIRLEEEGGGKREAESLRSLEVDDRLEFRRLLHGQVGGLGAFQDAIDVVGGAMSASTPSRAMAAYALSNALAPRASRSCSWSPNDRAARSVSPTTGSSCDPAVGSHSTATRETCGTASLSSSPHFPPLPGKRLSASERQSPDVSAWPRQAGHHPGANRIASDRHDDGDRAGRLPGSLDRCPPQQRSPRVQRRGGCVPRRLQQPMIVPVHFGVTCLGQLQRCLQTAVDFLHEGIRQAPQLPEDPALVQREQIDAVHYGILSQPRLLPLGRGNLDQ